MAGEARQCLSLVFAMQLEKTMQTTGPTPRTTLRNATVNRIAMWATSFAFAFVCVAADAITLTAV